MWVGTGRPDPTRQETTSLGTRTRACFGSTYTKIGNKDLLLLSFFMVYGQFVFYQLWQWGAAGWPYGKDVHSEDEPFSVFYLTEIFSFSHT